MKEFPTPEIKMDNNLRMFVAKIRLKKTMQEMPDAECGAWNNATNDKCVNAKLRGSHLPTSIPVRANTLEIARRITLGYTSRLHDRGLR